MDNMFIQVLAPVGHRHGSCFGGDAAAVCGGELFRRGAVPHEVLQQHMVDIQKATADFLEDAQEKYRDSLAKHNIGEKEVMFFDRIALERHDNAATRAELLQIAKHWILRLNADGLQMPL